MFKQEMFVKHEFPPQQQSRKWPWPWPTNLQSYSDYFHIDINQFTKFEVYWVVQFWAAQV